MIVCIPFEVYGENLPSLDVSRLYAEFEFVVVVRGLESLIDTSLSFYLSPFPPLPYYPIAYPNYYTTYSILPT